MSGVGVPSCSQIGLRHRVGAWTLPHIDPNAPALAAMFVVACAIVAIAIVAARVTVLRALARIP